MTAGDQPLQRAYFASCSRAIMIMIDVMHANSFDTKIPALTYPSHRARTQHRMQRQLKLSHPTHKTFDCLGSANNKSRAASNNRRFICGSMTRDTRSSDSLRRMNRSSSSCSSSGETGVSGAANAGGRNESSSNTCCNTLTLCLCLRKRNERWYKYCKSFIKDAEIVTHRASSGWT